MANTLADAITQLENTASQYNNPGAISGTGDTGTSFGQGIGIYSSPAAGQTALQNQIDSVYSGSSPYYPGGAGMTLDQFGSVYAPNDPAYGSNLASILNVPSSTQLSAITPYGGSSKSSWMPNWLSSRLSTLVGGTATPLKNDGTPSGGNFFGIAISNAATIVVGLILIAAGVFAFKTSQTVIQVVGKAAKSAATVTA